MKWVDQVKEGAGSRINHHSRGWVDNFGLKYTFDLLKKDKDIGLVLNHFSNVQSKDGLMDCFHNLVIQEPG